MNKIADFQTRQMGVVSKDHFENRSNLSRILSFLLPLVDGGLKGRLKHLRTIIKSRIKKLNLQQSVVCGWESGPQATAGGEQAPVTVGLAGNPCFILRV